MKKKLGFLLLFVILGALIGLFFAWLNFNGLFVRWESLGSPPEKVVSIININTVQTESGDLYFYKWAYPESSWEKTDLPIDNFNFADEIYPIYRCQAFEFLPFLYKYESSVSECYDYMFGASLIYLAIDKTGEVFKWANTIGEYWFVAYFGLPLLGAAIGLIIGLIPISNNLIIFIRKKVGKRT